MSVHTSILPPAGHVVDSAFTNSAVPFCVRQLSLEAWQRFVEHHPESTVFHHRNWIELLVSQYGGKVIILAVLDGDRMVTAIPFVETREVFGAKKLVSLPFSDCVPLLWSHAEDVAASEPCESLSATQTAAWQALQAALCTADFQRYRSIVVRSSEPLGTAPSESHWHRHLLRVDVPYQTILDNYSSSLRRNFRNAEASGMSFEVRTDRSAMDIFYQLHVITRQKLGVPVQPVRWFSQLHKLLIEQGLGFVGVVMKNGIPAAAAVFLTYKQSCIYKYGASNPSLLKERPNELLMGGAIRWANQHDYRVFDFGVSDKQQEGLSAFKRKLGGQESSAWHVYLTGTPQPMMQQWRARQLVSGLIRHSPSFVCRGIGKILYKFSQ